MYDDPSNQEVRIPNRSSPEDEFICESSRSVVMPCADLENEKDDNAVGRDLEPIKIEASEGLNLFDVDYSEENLQLSNLMPDYSMPNFDYLEEDFSSVVTETSDVLQQAVFPPDDQIPSTSKCKTPGKSFAPKIHKTVDKRPYECDECPKTFIRKNFLVRHKELHSGLEHSCGMCRKTFRAKYMLRNHMKIHSEREKHACDICKKNFYHKSKLKSHMTLHFPTKRYECETCDKKYYRKSHLDAHKIVHSGLRKHQCHTCEKSFPFKSTLDRHMRTHSDPRPYECDECGKAYAKRKSLNSHKCRKNYMIWKSLKCEKCLKEFASQRSLRGHVKWFHDPCNCGTCGVEVEGKKDFTAHLKSHVKSESIESSENN